MKRFTAAISVVIACAGIAWGEPVPKPFRAGAAAIDISPNNAPPNPPSIIAGGFLEKTATVVHDPLFVRSVVLDDGTTQIALVVVDTCMMPQALIDEAKVMASRRCGIAVNRMMVSATHTHSAPAAMACLGTRQDTVYAAWLPGKIAEAIVAAHGGLQPAHIGWASVDDWEHTHNRRWIRRPERQVVDPFGVANGRAHMHPGYLSADVIGPSGPVDPTLSVIAVQTAKGRPLAVLANYSQHYFGSAAVSSDYFGMFCKHLAAGIGEEGNGNGPFVCALSQGTSGDLMWMDYGSAAKSITLSHYAEEVAAHAIAALTGVRYRDSVSLAMVEKKLSLKYRVPDEKRLEWARPIAAEIENELPKNIREVYAMEAMILHARQSTEVTLQAIRIGELTIATLPTETYALTGLKLRGRSPASAHFTIELANGAEGYIPPPEQHALGGYTTWPARTAGLEVEAEPKIVDALVGALEEVTGRERRVMTDEHGPYPTAILAAHPVSYWRLNDEDGHLARNAVDGGTGARLQGGFAWFLPGIGAGSGIGSTEKLAASEFSGPHQINRAVHLAGGELVVPDVGLAQDFSVALWCWLGERSGASARSGSLCIGPSGEMLVARQEADHRMHVELNGIRSEETWPADDWTFVVLVRQRGNLHVFINGSATPLIQAVATESTDRASMRLGTGLEGKLDEIAVFDRPLTVKEIAFFWQTSGVPEPGPRAAAHQKPQLEALASKANPPPMLADDNRTASAGQPVAPLSPAESLNKIHVPDGFRVELVAAEPLVVDPVAFDWDESGRLWVVEMSDYPLGIDGKGAPGGRVRVLEDVDQDGRYEKSHLFADGLSFPNGTLTWRDGVIVTAAPQILFLRDTDGDGVCDQREVLLEGFNEGNQQLRMNGLRWGMDGWVYCANGGHHAKHGLETKVVSRRNGHTYAIGSRDFRFQPDSGTLELESGPSQFGRNRDAWGHWFGTQNANPLWHYVLADRYLARNPHVPTASPIQHVVGPGSPVVLPASSPEKRFHSFEQAGRFTSACSGMIYGDSVLFASGSASHAFICEPFHNLVQHNVLSDAGVSFVATREPTDGAFDFFASEDRWCRPVMARTGPDGGLWIADMYRFMIEHPDWLPPQGKAELLPNYRLGDDRGRIYRVTAENTPPAAPWTFRANDAAGLVAALDSANDWQRDKAQQMILWSRDAAAVPLLQSLFAASPRPQTRIQCLFTLDGLGALDKAQVIAAMADPHAGVRENAVRLAERHTDSDVIEAACRLAGDPDAKVCLQLALSLGEWDGPLAGQALISLASRFSTDPFMRAAIMSSAVRHADEFVRGLAHGNPQVLAAFRESLLRQAIGRNDLPAIDTLLHSALADSGEAEFAPLDAFLQTAQAVGVDLQELASGDQAHTLAAGLAIVDQRLSEAALLAADEGRTAEQRIAAAAVLTRVVRHRSEGISQLAQWLRPQIDPALQRQAITVLAQSGADGVPAILAAAWPEMSPLMQAATIDAWLSRKDWTDDLLQRMEKRQIQSGSCTLPQRSRLVRHPDHSTAQRARALFESAGDSTRKQVVERYRSAITGAGDVARGKLVYARACANCHRRGDEGNDVGPNLATVVSHSEEKLLTNILNPNVDIQPGYHSYTCVLETGEIIVGVLAAETANSVTIKQASGVLRSIARSEIDLLQNSNLSFMPEGVETSITPPEMRDLVAFLREPL